MRVKRRILVSAPRDIRLDAARIGIKRAIIDRIEQFGDELQVFLDPKGAIAHALGLPSSRSRSASSSG